MKRLIFLLSFTFFLSSSAAAQTLTWVDAVTGVAPSTIPLLGVPGDPTVKQASPGATYMMCALGSASEDWSAVNAELIWTPSCGGGGFTVQFFPDILGSDFTAEGRVFSCPAGTAVSSTACIRSLVDIDGGGVDNVTFDGDDGTDRDASGTAAQRSWQAGIPFPLIGPDFTVDVPNGVTACFVGTCPAR